MVTKVVEVDSIQVMEDGQVKVIEVTHYKEGGRVMSSRRDARMIDVGDDVTAENELVKDIVNGKLHKKSRKDARELVKNPPDQ